jgi:hypothetical protein
MQAPAAKPPMTPLLRPTSASRGTTKNRVSTSALFGKQARTAAKEPEFERCGRGPFQEVHGHEEFIARKKHTASNIELPIVVGVMDLLLFRTTQGWEPF